MDRQLSSNIGLHCLRCKTSTYSNRAITILRRFPYRWLRGYDSDNNMCFPGKRISPHTHTVQLNLNFTHMCRYTRVLARLMYAKLQKWCVHALLHAILACAHEIYSKHKRHTKHAHYELKLSCHTTRVV